MREFKSKDLLEESVKDLENFKENIGYVKKFDKSTNKKDGEDFLKVYLDKFKEHKKVSVSLKFEESSSELISEVTAEDENGEEISIYDEINLEDNPFTYKKFKDYEEFRKNYLSVIVSNLVLAKELSDELEKE